MGSLLNSLLRHIKITYITYRFYKLLGEEIMEQMIDSKKLQELLNISPTTLHKMESEGLPFTRIGKSKKYNLKEVKSWIANSQREIFDLLIGKVYCNEEIARTFKCSQTGGMRRSHTTNTLVIFSDHTKGIYCKRQVVLNTFC